MSRPDVRSVRHTPVVVQSHVRSTVDSLPPGSHHAAVSVVFTPQKCIVICVFGKALTSKE